MPARAASRNNGHPPIGGAKRLERGYPLLNAARRLYSPDLPALTWTLLMGVVEAVPPLRRARFYLGLSADIHVHLRSTFSWACSATSLTTIRTSSDRSALSAPLS